MATAKRVSYELCGGTHLDNTADIGLFLILSDSSAAAGVRRIEAVTGRGAYELVQRRFRALKQSGWLLTSTPEEVPHKIQTLQEELESARKRLAQQRQEMALVDFAASLRMCRWWRACLCWRHWLPNADADSLRAMADRFRDRYASGVAVVASAPDNRPVIIGVVTDDLIKRGLHAGDLVKAVAAVVGGSGGGRPNLAQAGGKDGAKLPEALAKAAEYVQNKLG